MRCVLVEVKSAPLDWDDAPLKFHRGTTHDASGLKGAHAERGATQRVCQITKGHCPAAAFLWPLSLGSVCRFHDRRSGSRRVYESRGTRCALFVWREAPQTPEHDTKRVTSIGRPLHNSSTRFGETGNHRSFTTPRLCLWCKCRASGISKTR